MENRAFSVFYPRLLAKKMRYDNTDEMAKKFGYFGLFLAKTVLQKFVRFFSKS